jgi:glycosyltransferase involved in cell wall biosynthesis
MDKKIILALESFYEGSHAQWWQGIQRSSQDNWKMLELSGHHWKWRMHGGAISLANQYLKNSFSFDLIWASDFVYLPLFQQILAGHGHPQRPAILYFHENQISYPWSPSDPDLGQKRDLHYAFINWSSAICAQKILFNSHYHYNSFFQGLEIFLSQLPDHQEKESIKQIEKKSQVLYLGLELLNSRTRSYQNKKPLILWNHRWEYDKNPDDFFSTLFQLSERGIDFDLAILGKQRPSQPRIFNLAKEKLNQHIVHWGHCDKREDYLSWLLKSDILPVTSNQDFFGMSTVEAISAGVYPLLPNRLAYPEHIPTNYHARNLYAKKEELLPLLVDTIKNPPSENERELLRSFVARYSWENMANKYDQISNDLTLGQ